MIADVVQIGLHAAGIALTFGPVVFFEWAELLLADDLTLNSWMLVRTLPFASIVFGFGASMYSWVVQSYDEDTEADKKQTASATTAAALLCTVALLMISLPAFIFFNWDDIVLVHVSWQLLALLGTLPPVCTYCELRQFYYIATGHTCATGVSSLASAIICLLTSALRDWDTTADFLRILCLFQLIRMALSELLLRAWLWLSKSESGDALPLVPSVSLKDLSSAIPFPLRLFMARTALLYGLYSALDCIILCNPAFLPSSFIQVLQLHELLRLLTAPLGLALLKLLAKPVELGDVRLNPAVYLAALAAVAGAAALNVAFMVEIIWLPTMLTALGWMVTLLCVFLMTASAAVDAVVAAIGYPFLVAKMLLFRLVLVSILVAAAPLVNSSQESAVVLIVSATGALCSLGVYFRGAQARSAATEEPNDEPNGDEPSETHPLIE